MDNKSSTTQPLMLSDNMSLDDRISNLPEPILLHILSFLSTKEAASTSVLSKPWRYLWTWVPDLDICHPEKPSYPKRFDNAILKVFLSRRAWRIRKLRLSCDLCFCDEANIHNILYSSVERDIEELDLSTIDDDSGYIDLPTSLLRCKTLVVLKVCGSIMIGSGSSVHLPSLKVLILRTKFKDEDSFRSIISGCPVLDYLVIGLDSVIAPHAVFHYEISSLTVRRVILCNGGLCFSNIPVKITVTAPALQYLTIGYDLTQRFLVLSNVSSSVHANFDICVLRFRDKYWEYVKNTFRALCNLQSLDLNFTYLKDHENNIPVDIFPVFDNLLKLKLISYRCPLPMLLNVLSKCSRLQHLTLVSKIGDCQCKQQQRWISPQHVPNFLTLHLTTVKFEGFEGLKGEIEFVQYVLNNSEALKNMTIIYQPKINLKRKFDAFLKISMSEMLARKCQLNFQQQV